MTTEQTKYEFQVKIKETDRETARRKLINLVEIGEKITADDSEGLKTALANNPKIVPFIKNIVNDYDTENLSMIDVITIAKKTFDAFKN